MVYFDAFAQSKGGSIKKVELVYDTNSVVELFNQCAIGIIITDHLGRIRKTSGYAGGDLKWSRIAIKSPIGIVQQGHLSFNRKMLRQHSYQIPFTIQFKDYDNQEVQAQLGIPFLTNIQFAHYTDSIKRGIHFYLNIEGAFSSGKVFPLDTTRIRFSSSAGTLIGQNVLLDLEDTLIKQIQVTAQYKGDRALRAESFIPVKQAPDDPKLILDNADHLFERNKRKKKP
jgi:hypothetical protein